MVKFDASKFSSGQKKDLDQRRLRGLCICPTCPTYTECAEEREELLFCVTGKSPDCVVRGIKCICPTCPVSKELQIRGTYYCMKGVARELQKR